MSRRLAALCLAVILPLVTLVWLAAAWAKYEPPPLRGHVVDAANALDDATEARLAARLEALRREKGFAIVVFLPASLDGLPVEDVAYDTFNTWGVGTETADDGVLLVVAPTERKVRIETGLGVGDRITDVQSSRIIREVMTPRLAAGDLPGAVDQGTRSIERALTGQDPVEAGPAAPVAPRARASTPLTLTQKLVMGGVAALVVVLSIVSSGFRRVLFSVLQMLLWAALMGRGGRGGGSGGGGGGGYGGGGGRSGGGGASGGW